VANYPAGLGGAQGIGGGYPPSDLFGQGQIAASQQSHQAAMAQALMSQEDHFRMLLQMNRPPGLPAVHPPKHKSLINDLQSELDEFIKDV